MKPHIACLCETWLKSTREPVFINYTSVFKHRPDRAGGGIAVLIRNDFHYTLKDLDMYPEGKLEIQGITVHNKHGQVDILNLYNPNQNVLETEFDHYFAQLRNGKVVVGDFNAHHQLWDTRSANNITGNNLAESLDNHPDLCLLTPLSLPTYYHVQTGNFSTLDLCFVSTGLYPLSQVELQPEMGSDHEPLLVTVNFTPSVARIKTRGRWKFDDDKWDKWKDSLPVIEQGTNLQENCEIFSTCLTTASHKVFSRSKETVNVKYSKPWWNDKCAELIKLRRAAKNRLKNHPTLDNLIALRRAEALVKRETKLAKKESFLTFCSEINSQTPVGKMWRRIGCLANKNRVRKCAPIVHQQQVITDSSTKANIIADQYAKLFNSNTHAVDSAPLLIPLTLALVDDSEIKYNKPFSLAEMFHAVSTLKNTSPGFDTIHNLMIKNLPINYLTWLLEITNSSFTCGSFPQIWKLAVILPILKPGKMPSDPKAYRPISLLSCIAKLMEKLVCRRLYYVLENSRSFSETQGGFRKRMCTLDQVARLELAIRTTLVNRKVCVAVFFDLSSAYDCVWHTGLLYKLSQCGIKGKLLCWIREYLLNRKFRVFFEGEYSTDRDISSGVPQGSILAPTLFNMMVSDLPRVNDVTLSEYADDITIYSCGYDINTIRTRVQQQVNLFLEWTQDWGLKLNDAKTKAMMFTRKKIRPPLIEIDNIPVEFVPSHRYLGMILDAPGLIWKEHIQYLRDASTAKVNVMKSVSHYHWGADRHVLLKFYKAVIRSKLDYGSVFYGSASQAQLSKLDKIQNKCLKIAIGARSTSPILSLEAESHVPPLRLHRMQTLLIFYCHLCEISAHTPVYGELFRDVNVQMNRSWAGTIFVPPVVVRSINLFSQLGLPPCSNNPTDNTSAIPPWFDVTEVCLTEFLNMSVGGMPNRGEIEGKIF